MGVGVTVGVGVAVGVGVGVAVGVGVLVGVAVGVGVAVAVGVGDGVLVAVAVGEGVAVGNAAARGVGSGDGCPQAAASAMKRADAKITVQTNGRRRDDISEFFMRHIVFGRTGAIKRRREAAGRGGGRGIGTSAKRRAYPNPRSQA